MLKKFQLIFIMVLSAFLVFSCSSDEEKEEIMNDDEKTDTMSTSDDDKTDTVSEYDDSDDTVVSDTDTSENDDLTTDSENDSDGESDDIDSDTDTSENDDDSDYDPDSDQTDSDDDTEPTDDGEPEVIIPEIPVVFGNICTGQTKCYNETAETDCPAEGKPFYGQDAEYAKAGKCIPQKFTVKGTGNEKIVFDENLKLEWQQKITKNVSTQS